jgi:hypothetical protein
MVCDRPRCIACGVNDVGVDSQVVAQSSSRSTSLERILSGSRQPSGTNALESLLLSTKTEEKKDVQVSRETSICTHGQSFPRVTCSIDALATHQCLTSRRSLLNLYIGRGIRL